MVEFQILRCVQCQTFQVLQVTKSMKWKCKLCGLKQSLLKVYNQGTGADCRRHVQKLNSLRGEIDRAMEDKLTTPASLASHSPGPLGGESCVVSVCHSEEVKTGSSRWEDFLEPVEQSDQAYHDNDVSQSPLAVQATSDWAEYREHTREQTQAKRKRTWNRSLAQTKSLKTGGQGRKERNDFNQKGQSDLLAKTDLCTPSIHGVRMQDIDSSIEPFSTRMLGPLPSQRNSGQVAGRLLGVHEQPNEDRATSRESHSSSKRKCMIKNAFSHTETAQLHLTEPTKESKWGTFLDSEAEDSDCDESAGENEVHAEITMWSDARVHTDEANSDHIRVYSRSENQCEDETNSDHVRAGSVSKSAVEAVCMTSCIPVSRTQSNQHFQLGFDLSDEEFDL